jgi:hypothetical protein
VGPLRGGLVPGQFSRIMISGCMLRSRYESTGVHHRGLSSTSEAQQEGRGAVLRTSLHSLLITIINQSARRRLRRRRGRDGAVPHISPCTIINQQYQLQQSARHSAKCKRNSGGGGVAVLCIYRQGGAVLLCTIINNYRSTRHTRRVFEGLRYFK